MCWIHFDCSKYFLRVHFRLKNACCYSCSAHSSLNLLIKMTMTRYGTRTKSTWSRSSSTKTQSRESLALHIFHGRLEITGRMLTKSLILKIKCCCEGFIRPRSQSNMSQTRINRKVRSLTKTSRARWPSRLKISYRDKWITKKKNKKSSKHRLLIS